MNFLKINTLPHTYGIVLCGGSSSRMGRDKSMLKYFDKPQRYHLYEMLQIFCEEVFISCNVEQSKNIDPEYDFLQDDISFGKVGPMAALLTAFIKYPQQNILLIGCDYPFLTVNELKLFAAFCKDETVSFYNQQDDIYEPVLAWYPYKCFKILKEMYAANQFSLQQFLKQSTASKYLPANVNCIKSIDAKEAFARALKQINET